MTFDAFSASASADPFKDFFAHQDQLNRLDSNIPEPVETKQESVVERQGDPHRMKKVDGELVDDYASNYTLPEFDSIAWMRVELFHNKRGSGMAEWVLKFIINQCETPAEVNTHATTREVFFNLYHGYKLDNAITNCHENPGFMQRFKRKVDVAVSFLKDQKNARPRGKKKTNCPVDKVVAGFCYVKRAPWGTVTFPQQQAIITPILDDKPEQIAILNLRQNEQRFTTIILRDVRNHIPSRAFQRADNAAVMVGYMDQVGYREWLNQQQGK